jgi:hypothetical protein
VNGNWGQVTGTRIIGNVGIVVGVKPDSETARQIEIIIDNENLDTTRALRLAGRKPQVLLGIGRDAIRFLV